MPNAYTRLVTWIYRGKRGHGSASSPVSPPSNPSILTAGKDTFQAQWAPPSIPWTNNTTLTFAFWSITGGADGPLATTDNPPPSVPVGNSDIMATAWYIQGGGNGKPAVFVDAFDVALGDFVDDDFVKVLDANSVPNPGLTTQANNEGFVPTAALEHIDAYSSIHAVPLSKWQVVIGNEAVNGNELDAAMGTSAIAFAFYQAQHAPAITGPTEESEWIYVSAGVKVGAGGFVIGPDGKPHPVGPWGPLTAKLLSTVALLSISTNMTENVRVQAVELASRHLTSVAEEIKKAVKSNQA
jgi:hypothetical protein